MVCHLVVERVVTVHAHEHAVEFRLDGEVAGHSPVDLLVDVLVSGTVQRIVQEEAEQEREFLLTGLVRPPAELVVSVTARQKALRLHSLAEVPVEDRDGIFELGVSGRR